MTFRLVLVRHGEAAAGFGDHVDPGLSGAGRAQAEALADALAPAGPLPIRVSPLRRTRQTAAPLATRWGVEPVVDAGVGELVSPHEDLQERWRWLQSLRDTWWAEIGPAEVRAWRELVLDTLRGIGADAVVVSHFVAINVAVGAATGNARFLVCSPAYCSRTTIDVDGDELRLVTMGDESRTVVR